MKNLLLSATIISAAALGFIAGGNTVVYAAKHQASPAFDYETCKAIVAKGSLDANPGVPLDWKEMTTTPGGNWCIR